MLAVGGAAIFVMSWLFTPALAIGVGYVFLHPILSAMGWDATWAGTIVVLLGLAAIALRSGRGRATAAATGSLPAFAAVYVAIVFIGLAVVVALFPAFAMEAVNRAFN